MLSDKSWKRLLDKAISAGSAVVFWLYPDYVPFPMRIIQFKVEILPSDGYLTENETADGSKKIEEQISDFLIRIESEIYLLECQSYDDGSMAIRIAEYAFIVARQFA